MFSRSQVAWEPPSGSGVPLASNQGTLRMTDENERRKLAEVSRLLGGQYEVADFLGSGAFGAVYKAYEINARRRTVAIKVLKKDQNDQESVSRFRQEALSLTEIGHPNVVTVYGHGVMSDGSRFLVMEYLE